MLVTEFGMIIDVKLQPEKAELPILVTEFGMVIEVNPLHLKKTKLSMFVTDSPIVADAKPLQP